MIKSVNIDITANETLVCVYDENDKCVCSFDPGNVEIIAASERARMIASSVTRDLADIEAIKCVIRGVL